ncbi:uncharacterized protein LOC122257406 [Penaeus japonicus]|uniref:uncharacterized protein LOC122257406 n=1 Tax=Penaeus japonicus TaxID=27405 RepID=UPI001C710A00|nr:uncharacterized protein LOC122257406 [Penaeus japonicus]
MTFHRIPMDTQTKLRSRRTVPAADVGTNCYLLLSLVIFFLTWTCSGQAPVTSGQSIIFSSLASPLRKLLPQALPLRQTGSFLQDPRPRRETATEETATPQTKSQEPAPDCCAWFATMLGAPCRCINIPFSEWGG